MDRQNRIKDLLNDALELEPASRDTFLHHSGGDDPAVLDEVRSLLAAHDRGAGFLVDPTLDGPTYSIGEVIGRYTVHRLIGEGGFGSVYAAEQREPVKRQVALKVIKLGMDTKQVIARFEAERQALAMMDHPNIASVYDAGATAAGRPYFVMELVKGVTLTEYCNRHRLSVVQRIELFRQVCSAVQHAHTKGVIHRDLKPSNVLVSNGDQNGPCPKVIDFGIAKSISARLTDKTVFTEFRHLVGTPEYMSPEQADVNAADIDTRSDIYSLGVLLYELLTGATPFDGQRLRSSTFVELQRIIREEEPPKPSTRLSSLKTLSSVAADRTIEPKRLVSQLRGDLDWIALKALEKNRDRRYDSAAELSDDLQRHLKHEPVQAGPPSRLYRLRKFVRRNRIGVLATSLIALAMIGGAVGITIGMVQARESAQETKAVNKFMQAILTSAKPEVDGADVRLVEVMDRASVAAAQRFAGHPLLEAEVRDLLGSVYADLSMQSKAKSEFRRAVDLWQEHAGVDDPRTIRSERSYVGSAINNQQIAEIDARLPDLAERAQRVFGPNDVLTLDVQRCIGISHMLHGRADEAERIFLDARTRLFANSDDDALQIHTLRNLVRIGRMKSYGADYDTRAAIVAQIEPLAKEQVERAVRAYGEASLVALDARIRWAQILADQRQYDAASQVGRDVLEAASNRLGECHVLRMEALGVLAEAAHRQGDSATAADLKLKIIACARQSGDVMALIVTTSDALPILDRGQRWVEGEALGREYLEKLQAMGGGHGDMMFDAEIWIARFVSSQGRLDEAESLFQSLLTRANQADLMPTVRARVHLFHGSNLCRQGSFEQSEMELQAAADLLKDFRLGTRNSTPDDVLIEFIALYNAWGKPEKALEYQEIREQTLANLPIDPS